MRALALCAALGVAACDPPERSSPPVSESAAAPAAPAPMAYPPVSPPEPGAPGGLPDERTPVSEAPFTPESAKGAADVVQTYFALIGEKRFGDAWRLWSDGGRASGQAEAAFARAMAAYPQYDAQVGAPGRVEGAAGSLYVDVPVVIYGRNPDGSELRRSGEVVMRRVNDVPGSSAEQRRWHIARMDLEP
jgi:hypothetical protein